MLLSHKTQTQMIKPCRFLASVCSLHVLAYIQVIKVTTGFSTSSSMSYGNTLSQDPNEHLLKERPYVSRHVLVLLLLATGRRHLNLVKPGAPVEAGVL